MTAFEIYRYTDPHKGFGKGDTVDFVVLDGEYPDKQPAQASMEQDAVEAAGYETYGHGAVPVSEEELGERIAGIEDKILDLQENLRVARGAKDQVESSDDASSTSSSVEDAGKRPDVEELFVEEKFLKDRRFEAGGEEQSDEGGRPPHDYDDPGSAAEDIGR